MFEATKPFKDTITGYDKEPSLRIGKKVPDNAVNLAYYFNPQPTEAERLLASDPPRQTIDHRIETQWLTKTNVASGPNGEEPSIDLFPKELYYSDEEGYAGRLKRQDNTVQWYPEEHVNQKEVHEERDWHITQKGDEIKVIGYDNDGYVGNLYLDASIYEIYEYRDVSTVEEVNFSINNFEINYHEITGMWLNQQDIDKGPWMNVPNPTAGADNCWPATITIEADGLIASDANANAINDTDNRVANFINNLKNNFPGTNDQFVNDPNIIETSKPVGVLYFDRLEYEPVDHINMTDGTITKPMNIGEIPCFWFPWEVSKDTYNLGDINQQQNNWQNAADASHLSGNNFWNIIPKFFLPGSDPNENVSPWAKTADYNLDPQGRVAGGTPLQYSYLSEETSAGGYDYSKIIDFVQIISALDAAGKGSYSNTISMLQNAMNNFNDIAIYITEINFHIEDITINMLTAHDEPYNSPIQTHVPDIADPRFGDNGVDDELTHGSHGTGVSGQTGGAVEAGDITDEMSYVCFSVKYQYQISDRGKDGEVLYNVTANYKSKTFPDGSESVKRSIKNNKQEAASYIAHSTYTGLVNKNWTDYDGIAYYMGSVTKGNAIGNQNPDEDNELLMFPNKDGLLRQVVEGIKEGTDENNRPTYETEYRDYYRVEADSIYLTDVFKDGEACFYKYRLKQPIYDYRGPDNDGFYKGDAVQLYTSTLKEVPHDHKHNIKLTVAEYEEKKSHDQFNNPVFEQVPKCYYADLFTNFISGSTDTFKVVYNGFNNIDNDNVVLDSGIEEDIYNTPYMIEGVDYQMQLVDEKARLNRIKILNYEPLKDERLRVTFTWKIIAESKEKGKTFESATRVSSILNKDYCIPCEYNQFEDRAMIISPKLTGDISPCSPMDLCLYDQSCYQTEDRDYEPIINVGDTDFIFKAVIVTINSSGSVNLKCNPDGSGHITAETTVDTGFYDEVRSSYTKKLDIENPYWTDGEFIYKGYKVKCIDSRLIKVKAPRKAELLDSWYPMIQFGHYSRIIDQYGAHTKICYSMPEYDKQHYSAIFGKPFMDIAGEKVTILNSHMVKTRCYPLYVLYDNKNKPGTVHLFKKIDNELFELTIKDISFSDGVIIVKEAVSENDTIIANYTYLEENYNYRGYWRDESDFIRVDLNPNIYHTYNDPDYLPSEIKPSKNLFNKVIYFFLKPSIEYEVSAENDSLVYDPEHDSLDNVTILENEDCLYHKIDNYEPDDDADILLGSIYIRQDTSLHSTILTDARTRGGGILSEMSDSLRHELEPESDFYLDIGYYDGKPYQENGVIIVRLDNELLKEYGGRFTMGDVEQKVKRWLGAGIYPIIEFVDSYKQEDLPQYTLEVEDSYSNILDITPEIYVEYQGE